MMTQNEKIVNVLLKEGATLTAAQAASRYKIRNLRARVAELRSIGVEIVSTMKETRGSDRPRAAYSLSPSGRKQLVAELCE